MPAAKGSARTPLGPKISKIVATYVYASSQGQRTHFAPTNKLIGNSESQKFSWIVEYLHENTYNHFRKNLYASKKMSEHLASWKNSHNISLQICLMCFGILFSLFATTYHGNLLKSIVRLRKNCNFLMSNKDDMKYEIVSGLKCRLEPFVIQSPSLERLIGFINI